jgi:hypothetical protein
MMFLSVTGICTIFLPKDNLPPKPLISKFVGRCYVVVCGVNPGRKNLTDQGSVTKSLY